MRNRPPQALPRWAAEAISPVLRDRLVNEPRTWRKAMQADPCSYCGETGGEADHIVAKSAGGADAWWNLTGSCGKCNREKGRLSPVGFLLGNECTGGKHAQPGLGTFGGLRVTVGSIEHLAPNRNNARSWTNRIVQTLIDAMGDTQGAVAYHQRRKNRRQEKKWLQILVTPADGADAGEVCRTLGGGGNKDRGAVESDVQLFRWIAKTPPDRAPETP